MMDTLQRTRRPSTAVPHQPARAEAPQPQVMHFLLLSEFSVMGFVSGIEPLRVANRFRDQSYRWRIVSRDGGPVTASNGMSVNADESLAGAVSVETVFVVAGFNPLKYHTPELASWLRRLQLNGAILGAVDTGAFVLAESRLLDTEAVTLHWETQAAFTARYPSLAVTQELFEIGKCCISCAGGTAAIDMMLALIGDEHGRDLAAKVSEQFVPGRIRSQSDHQRMEIAARYALHSRNTIQVVKLTREHIEDLHAKRLQTHG